MHSALAARGGHLTSARQVQRWREQQPRGRLAEGQEKAGRLSAARWLRGQRRGGARLGKPPSAGPGPASPTPRPGNLGTFHCLRSFPKHIIPLTMGLRGGAGNWGVRERSGPAGPRRSPGPGQWDRKPRTAAVPPGAQSAAPRRFPALPSGAPGARRGAGGVQAWPLGFRVVKGWESGSSGLREEGEFLERPLLDHGH